MRFHVPQFIEKESKLIGPLTLRQFLWFLAGATVFGIAYLIFTGTALVIAGAIIAAATGSLAYLKINEVPLPDYVRQAFVFALTDKKYNFQKSDGEKTENQ